jgi:3-oxoacyl-[acyl-carrier-protein] synthase III
MSGVRIIGAGAYVPPRVISNERIARAIPGWTPERIEEKTGIRERRFLWDFDDTSGQAIPPPEDAKHFYPRNGVDMAHVALERALGMAGMEAGQLDGLFLVTCTPDRLNFSHDAMSLHHSLGMRPDAFALVLDDGCAGTPYMMDMAQRMIAAGAYKTVAIIGSAFTSPLTNREVFTSELQLAPGKRPVNAYLSMYVFGDGAGAVVLQGGGSKDEGILHSLSGNEHGELVARRGGGQLNLPYQGRMKPVEMAFVVDGYAVARSYPTHMQHAVDGAFAKHPELKDQVKRYYFHQPNKRLMDSYTGRAGLPPEKVACNVDRYGNTSAAGKLILLAEDLEAGTVRLGSGDLVVTAAVGANVHYAAQLIRL